MHCVKKLCEPFVRFVFLYTAHFIAAILPSTRGFEIKNVLFRAAGIKIAAKAKIVGGCKFHFTNVIIGEESWIGSQCQFFSGLNTPIVIGNRVDIAPGCYFSTGTHKIGDDRRRAGTGQQKSIAIGDGTWIGMNSTFLAGASVGKGCIVAAGAVVKGRFPDNVMLGGVPAQIIKEFDYNRKSSGRPAAL